jgi:hypothetical protein
LRPFTVREIVFDETTSITPGPAWSADVSLPRTRETTPAPTAPPPMVRRKALRLTGFFFLRGVSMGDRAF